MNRYQTHRQYLDSPEFARVREAVKQRDARCQLCGLPWKENPGTQFDIDHTSYEYILIPTNPNRDFDKEVNCCRLLCRSCHRNSNPNIPKVDPAIYLEIEALGLGPDVIKLIYPGI